MDGRVRGSTGTLLSTCALLLVLASPVIVTVTGQQANFSRSLEPEPQNTSYHPLRHHQRPNDTSKLHYFAATLDDNENETSIEDRRSRNPGYIPSFPASSPSPSTGGSGSGSGSGFGSGHGSGQGHGGGRRNPLKVLYGWTEIDFTWPSSQARRDATQSGAYQSHNIIPLDVDVYEHNGKRKVFVTMPSGTGVPVALATVSTEGKKRSPKLAPYPDWSWHGNTSCQGISSVYRIMIDECSRLWVLDRGDSDQCTPQLLLFDLKNDQLVSRYRLPSNVLRNNSNLITIAVDIRHNQCDHAFAYIADVTRPAIIVFDAKRRESWRVEHESMRPITEYATYRIAGREFYLTDGVFGLALGPLRPNRGSGDGGEDRKLFFHPLASVYESWVPTRVLRRKENFRNGQNHASHEFHTSRARRVSQSAAQAMDSLGNLYSPLLSETALTCWNSELEFGGWNLPVIAADEETLQFPSGMKIHNGQIWIMTSRYQNFATDTMDWNDINYRILTGRLEDLVHGTSCDPRSSSGLNTLG